MSDFLTDEPINGSTGQPAPQPAPPDAEIAALRAIVEAGRIVFTCRGCNKAGWRLLIPKHARLGILCGNCGRVAVPDWKCAELLGAVDPLIGSLVDPRESGEAA